MRAVAQLRLTVTELDTSIQSLVDIFATDKWQIFIEAVKMYAKLDSESCNAKSTNNVIHIGLAMVNIVKTLRQRVK